MEKDRQVERFIDLGSEYTYAFSFHCNTSDDVSCQNKVEVELWYMGTQVHVACGRNKDDSFP